MRENIENYLIDFDTILNNISEVSKFLKFGRKKIGATLKEEILNVKEISKMPPNELQELIKTLKENKEEFASLKTVKKKFDLLDLILSYSEIKNESFDKLKKLIKEDFHAFANDESSLSEEAEAIARLDNIIKRLGVLLSFSGVFDKNIFAIGGGFSAGKSQFISSFFKDTSIKLPIGVKPTTAIPTYVTSGDEVTIKGFPEKGGNIEIPKEVYEELSHDFVKSFSFNLKDIMPVMAITTASNYSNICFIDTPGYDPSDIDGGYTNEDINTAKEFIAEANVLVWLIGLDSNGTVPATDISFIQSLNLENQKLYFVANKAGLKPSDQITEILDVIEETLSEECIEYEGISAYDSIMKKEFEFRGSSLVKFFDQQNKKANVHETILSELHEVCDMYDDAITKDLNRCKSIKKDLKALELDLLEIGFDKIDQVKSKDDEDDGQVNSNVTIFLKEFWSTECSNGETEHKFEDWLEVGAYNPIRINLQHYEKWLKKTDLNTKNYDIRTFWKDYFNQDYEDWCSNLVDQRYPEETSTFSMSMILHELYGTKKRERESQKAQSYQEELKDNEDWFAMYLAWRSKQSLAKNDCETHKSEDDDNGEMSIEDRLIKIQKEFSTSELEKHLRELEKLRTLMTNEVCKIFGVTKHN